jgi:serine/threonine-protein kinase
MKLVEGHDLAKLLEQRVAPSQDLPRFLTIFEQICQTLAYAHAQGVIHRDLKPHNVRVGAFGEVHLMDWGFAKELHQAPCNDSPPLSAAESTTVARIEDTVVEGFGTQAGQVFGSLPYMPPEQARGQVEQVDERSDVFGLGAILCEILTGRPPFTGSDGKEVFAKAKRCDRAEAMARLDGCGVDSKLLRLAKACLAAERGDRPRNAGVVAKGVKACLAGVQERLEAAQRERAAAQARAEEAGKTAEAEQARAEEAKKRAAAEEARAEAAERAAAAEQARAEGARKAAMAEQARAEEEKKRATAERQARRRTVWAAVTVLLVLVAGTVVSTLVAVYARQQADLADQKAQDAIDADKEKTKALKEVETTLIASLLRPIGQKGGRWTLSRSRR